MYKDGKHKWMERNLLDRFLEKGEIIDCSPPPSKKYTNLERLLLATISKGKRKRLEDSLVVLPFVRILASKKEGRAISLLGHIEKKLVLSQSNLADLEPTNKWKIIAYEYGRLSSPYATFRPKTSLVVRSKERRLYSQARKKFLTKIQVKLVIYIPGNVRNVVFVDVSEFRGIFLVVRVRESFNLPKKYLVFNVN